MRYSAEPRKKNMLKDMVFRHLLKNLEINMAKN